jgi:hypothetical protein
VVINRPLCCFPGVARDGRRCTELEELKGEGWARLRTFD